MKSDEKFTNDKLRAAQADFNDGWTAAGARREYGYPAMRPAVRARAQASAPRDAESGNGKPGDRRRPVAAGAGNGAYAPAPRDSASRRRAAPADNAAGRTSPSDSPDSRASPSDSAGRNRPPPPDPAAEPRPGDAGASAGRRVAGRLAFVFLIALTAALLLGATPLFSISQIEVGGNYFYSDSQIIAKSGLKAGQNGFAALRGRNVAKILSFRCAEAEQAILNASPYIKSSNVRYVPPRTIRIDVEERAKSVVVRYFESGLLIDEEGVVVDVIKNYRQSELPVVLGLPAAQYEIGKAFAAGGDAGLATAIAIVGAMRQADRDGDEQLTWKINAIDVADRRGILLELDNGVSVNLGDATDLYYRISAANEIIIHGVEKGETGVISFANGARPVFVPGNAVAANRTAA